MYTGARTCGHNRPHRCGAYSLTHTHIQCTQAPVYVATTGLKVVGLGFGGLRKIVEGADIFVGRYLLLTTVGYVGLKFLKFKGVLTIESIGAFFSGAGSVVRWVFCSRFLYLSLVSLALLIAPECKYTYVFICMYKYYFSRARVRELSRSLFVFSPSVSLFPSLALPLSVERWGAGVETQKNVRGEIGEWGRVPFNETYAPSLSTIYDGA